MILRKMAVGNETGQALHKNGLRLSIKQGAVQPIQQEKSPLLIVGQLFHLILSRKACGLILKINSYKGYCILSKK